MRKYKKRKNNNFFKYMLVLSCIIFIVGNIFLTSYEYNLNVKTVRLSREITLLEADVDSLDIEIHELTSFDKLLDVTSEAGLTYKGQDAVAIVSAKHDIQ